MDRPERIGVVGAGIIGLAVAFELADRGATVHVFDGRRVGGGATHASAGILAPYTEAHHGGPLFDLTVRGLGEYEGFVARVREATHLSFEFRRSGTLEVAEDAARAAHLRSRLDEPWAASAGLRWLDAASLQGASPLVADTALGALECPVHAHVAVPSFAAALADALSKFGVRLHVPVSIDRIQLTASGVSLESSVGVHLVDRVILCSGAWTAAVDPFGGDERRITPIRGQLVALSAERLALRQILWGTGCYIVPWSDGTVLVGATSEDVGFDERATAAGVRQLLASAEGLVPALASATFLRVQVGLRPATADGLPILGPARDPRVVYAAGHYRNGVLLATLTARLIADYVLAGTVDPAFTVV